MKEPSLINISEKVIKKQRRILIIATILVITLFIGSSYSLLTSHDETEEVITVSTGKLNMKIEIDKGISLGEELPKSDEEGFLNQEVKITLENTGTIDIGRYEVKLMNDTSKESTLDEKYIKYSISEDDNKRYQVSDTLENDKNIIYTGYNLKVDSNKIIYLKLWLDSETGEEILSKNYYGSINVELYQEDKHENNLVEEVKSKLVSNYSGSKEDFSGGLIAVNQTGDLYKENNNEEIREYRYSGLNVNNYVTFNNELWRIIGVFKDENNIEHVKIVRNEQLNRSIFPQTYTINEIQYKLDTGNSYAMFWNYVKGNGIDNNDWSTSGLQYWLNTKNDTDGQNKGYLSYLKDDSEAMIENTIFYLGTLTSVYSEDIIGISNTTKEAYQYERAISGCEGKIGPATNNNQTAIESNSNCRVWANNSAIWTGKIGLMYPSDYGYSSLNKYWDTKLGKNQFNIEAFNTTWLQKEANHIHPEWCISPTSEVFYGVGVWYDRGTIEFSGVAGASAPRPTLYLKSNVKITKGDGSINNPYELTI